MNKLYKMSLDIEKLRKELYRLIEIENHVMTSPEIVTASQKLDELIVEYNKLKIEIESQL